MNERTMHWVFHVHVLDCDIFGMGNLVIFGVNLVEKGESYRH